VARLDWLYKKIDKRARGLHHFKNLKTNTIQINTYIVSWSILKADGRVTYSHIKQLAYLLRQLDN
jgi:hypothetical protein